VLVKSDMYWLFVVLKVAVFFMKRKSLLLLGVRNLGRGRKGIVGKLKGGVCAGKWVCGKRVIVWVGS
jgi:hypothetical protein